MRKQYTSVSCYCKKLLKVFILLVKDKRIARKYGYSTWETDTVVRDYCYSRWAPRYSAISTISSEGLVFNWLLKNPEESFDVCTFIQFLDERLLPAMGKTRDLLL